MATTDLYSAEQYFATIVPDRPTELVRGEIVPMDFPGYRHGRLIGDIIITLGVVVRQGKLGRIHGGDAGVVTERNPDTVRGPDVAFYSKDRAAPGEEPAGYWRLSPDLVCEVLSPSDRRIDVLGKTAEYLRAGVETVVIFDPDANSVEVYSANAPTRIAVGDEIVELPKPFDGLRMSANQWLLPSDL